MYASPSLSLLNTLLSLPPPFPKIHTLLTRVGEEVEDERLVGVHAPDTEFRQSTLQLHDGVVPVRRLGEGGREGGIGREGWGGGRVVGS